MNGGKEKIIRICIRSGSPISVGLFYKMNFRMRFYSVKEFCHLKKMEIAK